MSLNTAHSILSRAETGHDLIHFLTLIANNDDTLFTGEAYV